MTMLTREPVDTRSEQERLDAGKVLRQTVPRQAHRQWKPSASRTPLEILRAADAGRLPELVPIRYARMLQSPFAFYRGTAAVMAADLQATSSTGIIVQACGDCHVMNFGGFATPERRIVFDINDFDETLPAPWEWDVKRLAASFVLAARSNGIADDSAQEAAVECARSYRESIREFAPMDALQLWYMSMDVHSIIEDIPNDRRKARAKRRLDAALSRTSNVEYPKIAQMTHGAIHVRDVRPLIFHPEGANSAEFYDLAEEVLSRYRDTLPHERRILFDRYKFVDAAIKVVGIGSVGTRCWVVLMMTSSNHPLFLQLKQAGRSVLEPYTQPSLYEHNGQRVVVGQRIMQAASDIFLGWTRHGEIEFYVRQLRDVKVSPLVEKFDAPMFLFYAQVCGRNLARAHAKSGDGSLIAGYLGKSDEFDQAIGKFSVTYADQTERDHAAALAAVKAGRIAVAT